MKTGDAVMLISGDERTVGVLELCSANEQSLLVTFDGMFASHVGGIPLLRESRDPALTWRALINGVPIIVKPLSEAVS
jgi:hypothetical protein